MKTAIIILSDPNSGEEALGRVFNALAAAYDYQQHDAEVTILFQGAGTRWIAELGKPDHPVHGLFEAVKERVAGVSRGCADVFGATGAVEKSAFGFVTDNAVPGTAGLPSLYRLASEGYSILSF
ncbi:MAG: DsrE family protein [Pseudomonadota bacterium]